mmetsp:Transcript_12108/g.50297  ORF Transcript_12108/g.50297 Transcript_12108/m.50297 type:complete len:216 (-) Transcript_12108:51-698(-)
MSQTSQVIVHGLDPSSAPSPFKRIEKDLHRSWRLGARWRGPVSPAAFRTAAKASTTSFPILRAEIATWTHLLFTKASPKTTSGPTALRTRSLLRLFLGSIRLHIVRVVEVTLQVLNSVLSQKVIKVLPAEHFLNVSARLKTLHQLQHVQIRDIHVLVARKVVVLWRNHHPILEQLLVDLHTSFLRQKHLDLFHKKKRISTRSFHNSFAPLQYQPL